MMRSAIAFLPPCMMTFMNLASSMLPYLGSGRISRLGTSRRRGMVSPLCFSWRSFEHRESHQDPHLLDPISGHYAGSGSQPGQHLETTKNESLPALPGPGPLSLLRPLRAVLGTRLLAVFHALQVERTAHDVVTHTRQVLDTTATNQHDAVFLQVVAFAADV